MTGLLPFLGNFILPVEREEDNPHDRPNFANLNLSYFQLARELNITVQLQGILTYSNRGSELGLPGPPRSERELILRLGLVPSELYIPELSLRRDLIHNRVIIFGWE